MFGIAPIKIVISGVDQFSSVIRNAVKDVKKLGSDIDQVGRGLTKMGIALTGIGLGLAHATGITEIPKLALEAQHSLRELGNVGGFTANELSKIGIQMQGVSKETNQAMPDLFDATRALVASGMDLKVAMGFLPAIGKAATAEQANIVDLARVSISVWDNMGISAEKLGKSIDIMTKAGKIGRFELADMAREFPKITASAAYLGLKGPEGISKIAAALQVAVKGAMDPAAAATNFGNFLNKITSQKTMKNFMKIPNGPINMVTELNKALQPGHDVLEDMVKLVHRVITAPSHGVAPTQAAMVARTNFLFRDQQILDFIKVMVPKLELYKQIRDKSLAADGEVTNDYKSMMTTLIEQWKQFKISLATTLMPKLEGPMRAVSRILDYINKNQDAINKIAKVIIGMVAAGAVLTTLGAIAGGIGAVIGVLTSQIFWIVAAVIGFGIGLVAFFKNWNAGWAKALQFVLIFATPFTGIVLLVIRHWTKLLPFFKLLWLGISGVFKLAATAIGFVLKPVIWFMEKLFDLVNWVIDKFLDLMGLAAKIALPKWLQNKIGLEQAFPDSPKTNDNDAKIRGTEKPAPNVSPFDAYLKRTKDKIDVNVTLGNVPKGTEVKTKGTPGINFDITKLGFAFGSP